MIFVVAILFILTIVITLIILGKPIDIDCRVDNFLDSFERTDYNKNGRIKCDYLVWGFSEYVIKVNYFIFYKLVKNPFNRKNTISVKLDNIILPEGFQISLKEDSEDSKEYHSDYELMLSNCTSFIVKIYQIDNYINLSHPQLIKFYINIFLKVTNIRKTINYEFLIGENLGDSWVALDFGTTGSSIAFGNDNHNIGVLKNRKGNQITPSVLVFDKKNIETTFYGDEAESRIGSTDNYIGFRSIKKLLGFKDKNVEVCKEGKDLAAILVNKTFNDVLQVDENNVIGLEEAKRAVVAIPNNYTATKIKDMLFCIENLERFKEIRFIHEAEAILFYYLSNKSSLNEQFDCKNIKNNEIILVFDMGGATINTTVAQINKETNDTYEVKVLSKIGYGIGGDSIDYCILKSIFDFTSEIPGLQGINVFDDTTKAKLSEQEYNRVKEDLIKFSFGIKKKITQNQRKSELISATDLDILLSDLLSENISIDVEGNFYRIFKSKSRHCILQNQYFSQLIYANVSDAINEVMKITGNFKIDKVILSGRSSSFPNIENTVTGTTSCFEIINLDKIGAAKTAVAEGACWYGVNNNCIKLNNLKTSANFGFTKTESLDKKDLRFINLLEAGTPFMDREQEKIKSTQKIINFKDRFNFDSGNKVNFYQVMSNDCKTVIAENQRHKFSKVASIKLVQESERIGIKVYENDDVCCSVKMATDLLKEKGAVADQEITDANDKHYTWVIN
ncbi:MAG: Hsp70 family protein [Bacteroidales bacterium]|jgi:hypothetical protein|nr:Hsp70 family protein [Bacteroidales bacterium]